MIESCPAWCIMPVAGHHEIHLECVKVYDEKHGMQGGNCNPDPNQRRVTVMISDVCEPCSPPGDDHIDLQALTFLKVMPSWPLTSLRPAMCMLPAGSLQEILQGTRCAMAQAPLCQRIRCGCMLRAAVSSGACTPYHQHFQSSRPRCR